VLVKEEQPNKQDNNKRPRLEKRNLKNEETDTIDNEQRRRLLVVVE
jgi:hypothetical protein